MSMYNKKPLQCCKVISLQLIKINEKKKKENLKKKKSQSKPISSSDFDILRLYNLHLIL